MSRVVGLSYPPQPCPPPPPLYPPPLPPATHHPSSPFSLKPPRQCHDTNSLIISRLLVLSASLLLLLFCVAIPVVSSVLQRFHSSSTSKKTPLCSMYVRGSNRQLLRAVCQSYLQGCKPSNLCLNPGTVHNDLGSFRHEDILFGYFLACSDSCAHFECPVRVHFDERTVRLFEVVFSTLDSMVYWVGKVLSGFRLGR